MWKICGYELNRGEKLQVMLHPNGREYEIPTTLICGAQEGTGMTLLITAQIHAGEYNGTAAAMRLAKKIDPGKLRGNVILMHCVNTDGFWQQIPRFIPQDHVNLNADYPGNESGTIGQQIAAWFVKEIFPAVDFITDLHGGGISETLESCIFFPRAPKVRDCALEAAKKMNVKYLLASSNSVGEYGYAANYMDIPGFILECGYGGLTREEWVQQVQECMELLLDHFDMYLLEPLTGRNLSGASETEEQSVDGNLPKISKDEGLPARKTYRKKLFEETEYLESDMRGVWYPAVCENQSVKKGDLLGELGDFFGNMKKRYYAIGDGTVIYYTSGMSVLEGDALVAYGLEDSAEEV